MKSFITLALLSASFTIPMVHAQSATTTPVGYTTETLKASQFNLIGLTLHSSSLINSTITSSNATSVTDSTADFDTLLTTGSTYILEISGLGVIQEITSWTGGTLNTPDDITGFITDGTTEYAIRKAVTISELFGSANEVGFIEGNSTTIADVIWLPTGGGSFTKYFYHPGSAFPPITEGWKEDGNLSVDASDTPLIYVDALLIQKRGVDLDLTISGEVKAANTNLVVEGNGTSLFNFLSGVYPAATTLDQSGLETSLLHGNTTSTADVVWMPSQSGAGYDKFFYTDGSAFPPVSAGWKNAFGDPAGTQSISSGIIIQRRQGNVNASINAPSL